MDRLGEILRPECHSASTPATDQDVAVCVSTPVAVKPQAEIT